MRLTRGGKMKVDLERDCIIMLALVLFALWLAQ